MIEDAAKQLSELVGWKFCVHEDKISLFLMPQDDWDTVFEFLNKYCKLLEWNGAYIPGIKGTYENYPLAVIGCGCC